MSDKWEIETIPACLLLILLAPVIIAAEAIVSGLVLVSLWRWFIVPLGVPAITLAVAIGISCVVGLLAHQDQPRDKDGDWSSAVTKIFTAIVLRPGLFWLLGFAAHKTAS